MKVNVMLYVPEWHRYEEVVGAADKKRGERKQRIEQAWEHVGVIIL